MNEERSANTPDVTKAMNDAANHNQAVQRLTSVNQEKLPPQARSEVGAAIRKQREEAAAARGRVEQGKQPVTVQQIKDLESQRETPAPTPSLTIGGQTENAVHREVAEKREAEIAAFKEQIRASQERSREAFDRAR